jgi:hypothetical protein
MSNKKQIGYTVKIILSENCILLSDGESFDKEHKFKKYRNSQ